MNSEAPFITPTPPALFDRAVASLGGAVVDRSRGLTALFGLTLFVSSALVFVAEPMFGKMVLPRLGGSPAVWNTCMVFFQALLLAGYAYAHALTRLSLRRQTVVHTGLFAL